MQPSQPPRPAPIAGPALFLSAPSSSAEASPSRVRSFPNGPSGDDAEEARRLAALERYGLTGTPPEASFDRVTRLVSRWLDVPIALVTLIDADRMWLKSCVGLDRQETSREVSFCAHNLSGDAVMVVEDATQDPRFADNPLVTGPPHIRFYAGAPLRTPDGYVLGSLCAIDTTPRTADTVDLDALHDLAQMVVAELELRHTNNLLAERNRQLEERNQQIRSLSRALRDAEETGRVQLSDMLQEELLQTLQAARIGLENAAATPRLLERARQGLDEAIQLTHTLSGRFAPPVGTQPLQETLAWLAQRMRTVHGLSVSVTGDGPSPTSEAVSTLLYRLMRALLFEVARQPGTAATTVHITTAPDTLTLTVAGDFPKAGFASSFERADGPLARLRRQVEAIGGRITERSADADPSLTIVLPPAE